MSWTAGTKTIYKRYWIPLSARPTPLDFAYLYATSTILGAPGWLDWGPFSYDDISAYPLTGTLEAYPPPNLPGEVFELVSLTWDLTGNTRSGPGGTEYEWEWAAVVNYPSSYNGVVPGHLFNLRLDFEVLITGDAHPTAIPFFMGVGNALQNDEVGALPISHTHQPLAVTPSGFRIHVENLAVGLPSPPAGMPLGTIVDWKWGLVPTFRTGFSENDPTYGIWNYRTSASSIDIDIPARSERFQLHAVAFDEYGVVYEADTYYVIFPGLGADAVADVNGDIWALAPDTSVAPIIVTPDMSADFSPGILRRFPAGKSALVEVETELPLLSAFGSVSGDAQSLCLYGDARWWLRSTVGYYAPLDISIFRSDLYRDNVFSAHVWTNNHDLATLCAMPLGAGFGSAAVQVQGDGFTGPLLRFKHTEKPDEWPADADAVLVADLTGIPLLGISPLSPFWVLPQSHEGSGILYITDGLTRAFVSRSFGASWDEIPFVPPPDIADYVRVRETANGAFVWLGLVNAPGAPTYLAYITYDLFQTWEALPAPSIASANAVSPVIGHFLVAGSGKHFATNAVDKVELFDGSAWSVS